MLKKLHTARITVKLKMFANDLFSEFSDPLINAKLSCAKCASGSNAKLYSDAILEQMKLEAEFSGAG